MMKVKEELFGCAVWNGMLVKKEKKLEKTW